MKSFNECVEHKERDLFLKTIDTRELKEIVVS